MIRTDQELLQEIEEQAEDLSQQESDFVWKQLAKVRAGGRLTSTQREKAEEILAERCCRGAG